MTLRKTIRLAQALGINVQYRERSGGGVEVTKINGVSYKARKGNEALRNLIGVTQSEAQVRHQEKLNKTMKKGTFGRPRKEPLDKKIINRINNINTKLREREAELIKLKGSKLKKEEELGRVTRDKYRWILKNKGLQSAEDYLSVMERYARGYAHLANIEHLRSRIAIDFGKLKRTQDYYDVIAMLDRIIALKGSNMKESTLKDIIDDLYDLEKKAMLPQDFLARTKTKLSRVKQ